MTLPLGNQFSLTPSFAWLSFLIYVLVAADDWVQSNIKWRAELGGASHHCMDTCASLSNDENGFSMYYDWLSC